MTKRFMYLIAVCALLALVPFALAQDATPTAPFDENGVPVQFEAILADLSTRTGSTVTRQSLTGFTWAEETFDDASLGCPQEGQSYAQAITPGYRFTIDYNGVTYDYRVAQETGTIVLCSESINAELTATAEANATPEVDENVLTQCDSTLILLTYIAQRDYGFEPMVDLTTFELGQFTSDFQTLMAGGDMEADMDATEEGEAMDEEMMATEEAAAGTTADQALNTVTLEPGIVANEDPACTLLREEVEAYLIGEIRGEMMESGS
jgi:hypothetical protein